MGATNIIPALKATSPHIVLRILPSDLASSSAETVMPTAEPDLAKSLDGVFSINSTQEQVFQGTASSLVDRLLEGCNAALLVYGSSQSAKTYTLGTSPDAPKDTQQEGLIPRTSHLLFEKLLLKSTNIRSIPSLRPSSVRLRPTSYINTPQRRGSTSNLLVPQAPVKAVPTIPGASNGKASRYTVHVAYEEFLDNNLISLVDPVAVRNTGDVLRYLEKAASLNRTCSSTRLTLSLTTERWVAKPAPERRVNVRAMVGQMEKRNQDEEKNGEWIKTESHIHIIDLHSRQTLSPNWMDVLKSDIGLVALLCLKQETPDADTWIKHARSLREMSVDLWLEQVPDPVSEKRQNKSIIKVETTVLPNVASTTAVMSPSASTAGSSSSACDEDDEDDDMCRPSSSARTTLTIPDDDATLVADLKHQVEELLNQVAILQERNTHVEGQLQQKIELDEDRDTAVAQYLGAIEQFAADDNRVRSLVHQLKTGILPSKSRSTLFANPLQEDLDDARAQLDRVRAERNEDKAGHARAIEAMTLELETARKDHGWIRAEHAKVLEKKAAEREQICKEIKTTASARDQARADKDLLEFQLEQTQQVNDELQAELTEARESNERLETALDASRAAKDAIATELAKGLDVKTKSEAKIQVLQAQAEENRQRFEAMMEQKETELETLRCSLSAERDASRDTAHRLTAELEAAQAQVCEYAEELRAFQALATARIADAERQIRAFQKLEHTQTAVIAQLTNKVTMQDHLTETITGQLETQDACVAMLEKDRDEADETVQWLERELDRIGEDRASLQRLIEYVDKALCRNTDETDRMNEQLLVDIKPRMEVIEQERLELLQKLDEQTRQIELYHVDEGEIRAVMASLESRLQSLHQTHAADQTKIEQARLREAEAVKISESLVDKVAQLAQENAELQSQLNKVSPRGSLASLPPPSAPPSNPLPPIPSALPALPSTTTAATTSVGSSSRPQSPPASFRSTSLLQRRNSSNTLVTSSIVTADIENASTPDKYERIIRALQRKIQFAETEVKTHQGLVSKLEAQVSRYEHKVQEIKRQVDILSREKQASSLEIQNLRSQVSSHHETARQLEGYKTLESQLSKERQLKEKAERAKMILENRMEELMNQRKSKFMCF